VDRRDRLQYNDRAAGRQVFTEIDLPDAELTGERGFDPLLVDQRALLARLRLAAFERSRALFQLGLGNQALARKRALSLQVGACLLCLSAQAGQPRLVRIRAQLDQPAPFSTRCVMYGSRWNQTGLRASGRCSN
jgi:hypothetical protein